MDKYSIYVNLIIAASTLAAGVLGALIPSWLTSKKEKRNSLVSIRAKFRKALYVFHDSVMTFNNYSVKLAVLEHNGVVPTPLLPQRESLDKYVREYRLIMTQAKAEILELIAEYQATANSIKLERAALSFELVNVREFTPRNIKEYLEGPELVDHYTSELHLEYLNDINPKLCEIATEMGIVSIEET